MKTLDITSGSSHCTGSKFGCNAIRLARLVAVQCLPQQRRRVFWPALAQANLSEAAQHFGVWRIGMKVTFKDRRGCIDPAPGKAFVRCIDRELADARRIILIYYHWPRLDTVFLNARFRVLHSSQNIKATCFTINTIHSTTANIEAESLIEMRPATLFANKIHGTVSG